MVDSRKAVTLVVALLVGALMSAFLLPIGIDAMSGDESQTATLEIDEKISLQPGMNVSLTDTTANTSASYVVDAGPDSESTTINVGEEDTVTVDGEDVTINVSEATSTTATATFDYPGTYGWGAGAASLWFILPVLLVLAVFLYFVSMALREL